MDEPQIPILRQIARLLTIGCVLLAVCAGLLVKVALDTHATRPKPFSIYIKPGQSYDAEVTGLVSEGRVITWVEADSLGGRRVVGW